MLRSRFTKYNASQNYRLLILNLIQSIWNNRCTKKIKDKSKRILNINRNKTNTIMTLKFFKKYASTIEHTAVGNDSIIESRDQTKRTVIIWYTSTATSSTQQIIAEKVYRLRIGRHIPVGGSQGIFDFSSDMKAFNTGVGWPIWNGKKNVQTNR